MTRGSEMVFAGDLTDSEWLQRLDDASELDNGRPCRHGEFNNFSIDFLCGLNSMSRWPNADGRFQLGKLQVWIVLVSA